MSICGDVDDKRFRTYPRIPSTPSKPNDTFATPIPWFAMTRSGLSVTVSVHSSPDHRPDPYVTDYVCNRQHALFMRHGERCNASQLALTALYPVSWLVDVRT